MHGPFEGPAFSAEARRQSLTSEPSTVPSSKTSKAKQIRAEGEPRSREVHQPVLSLVLIRYEASLTISTSASLLTTRSGLEIGQVGCFAADREREQS